RPPPRPPPLPYTTLFRSHAPFPPNAGGWAPGFDRVLRWEFTRSDGGHTLIAEVMGKHSDLVLVDAEETILGAIKWVPAAVSRARQILPGLSYAPPPGDRLDPLTVDRAGFLAVMEEQLRARDQTESGNAASAADALDRLVAPSLEPADLVRTLAGFGPFAAAEVLARAPGTDLAAVWTAVSDLA